MYSTRSNWDSHYSPGRGCGESTGDRFTERVLGNIMRYWVQASGVEWIVDQSDPGGDSAFSGEVVLSIKPERVHVIVP